MSNIPVTHRILYRLGIYRYHSNTFQNFKYKNLHTFSFKKTEETECLYL